MRARIAGVMAMVVPSAVHAQLSVRSIDVFATAGGIGGATSADIVVPNANTSVNGRRRPIVEFGFGYRYRTLTAIAPLPSPRQ